jgi:hypothetical protein
MASARRRTYKSSSGSRRALLLSVSILDIHLTQPHGIITFSLDINYIPYAASWHQPGGEHAKGVRGGGMHQTQTLIQLRCFQPNIYIYRERERERYMLLTQPHVRLGNREKCRHSAKDASPSLDALGRSLSFKLRTTPGTKIRGVVHYFYLLLNSLRSLMASVRRRTCKRSAGRRRAFHQRSPARRWRQV